MSTREFFKKKVQNPPREQKDGDPDPRTYPYMYFHTSLAAQVPALEVLLNLSWSMNDKSKDKSVQLANRKSATGGNILEISFDIVRLDSELESFIEARHLYAASMFVVLNTLNLALCNRLGVDINEAVAGRKIGNTNLLQLIRAASNNFRHYEEWTTQWSKGDRDISVLQAAGLSRPWDRNLCGDVLSLIGWKDIEAVHREMRFLGSELFQNKTGIPL